MKIVIVDDDCLVTGALKTILEVNEDVDVVEQDWMEGMLYGYMASINRMCF